MQLLLVEAWFHIKGRRSTKDAESPSATFGLNVFRCRQRFFRVEGRYADM
jgi:hypothetical protein